MSPPSDDPRGDPRGADLRGDGTTVERAVRVVIVDDDALVRAGLRMILGGAPDVEIVGEASDGIQGVSLVESTEPDVVLMDIRMPGRDGLEATRVLLSPDVQGKREHAVCASSC